MLGKFVYIESIYTVQYAGGIFRKFTSISDRSPNS